MKSSSIIETTKIIRFHQNWFTFIYGFKPLIEYETNFQWHLELLLSSNQLLTIRVALGTDEIRTIRP